MISFILAQICAVLCIAILIAGVVMVRKKDERDEEFDEDDGLFLGLMDEEDDDPSTDWSKTSIFDD